MSVHRKNFDWRQPIGWQTASAFALLVATAGVVTFPVIVYWSIQMRSWFHVLFGVMMTLGCAVLCRMSWSRLRYENRRLREEKNQLPDTVFRKLGEKPREL